MSYFAQPLKCYLSFVTATFQSFLRSENGINTSCPAELTVKIGAYAVPPQLLTTYSSRFCDWPYPASRWTVLPSNAIQIRTHGSDLFHAPSQLENTSCGYSSSDLWRSQGSITSTMLPQFIEYFIQITQYIMHLYTKVPSISLCSQNSKLEKTEP